ncbi:MAG: amidohydrolase [Eubacteriales bacterium]|nr:amidohydrolase [Eubacteriales bacterium]
MKTLFSNITLLDHDGTTTPNAYLLVDGKIIKEISQVPPAVTPDRIIDGSGKVLMPAFYNLHTHAAMTLFRGYGEDLPLSRWLHERIFPAEDRLYDEAVYVASLVACAEMLRGGIASFSDMYFFCDQTANAVAQTGIKANISRAISCFDPDMTAERDVRFAQAKALHRTYHNACDGRIKIDMAIHAEYTATPAACRWVSEYAAQQGLLLHLHLSETQKEQQECIQRHGKTPAAFFHEIGAFQAKTIAAHCVHVTDADIEILRADDVTVVHNPVSNLKLGSGIMPVSKFLKAGVPIAIGTDGAASNNHLDLLREMNFAALLQKGRDGVCDMMQAKDFLHMATRAGALAQGREDCGILQQGARADLVLLDLRDIGCQPVYDVATAVVYAADTRCVQMTMVDGEVLYENGRYYTIDIASVQSRFSKIVTNYFSD